MSRMSTYNGDSGRKLKKASFIENPYTMSKARRAQISLETAIKEHIKHVAKAGKQHINGTAK